MLKRLYKSIRYRLGFRTTYPIDPAYPLLTRLGITAPVIFDVGAHHGESALGYARLFPAARIWSFEPYPPAFDQLVAAAADNHQIMPVPLALADQPGHTRLYVNEYDAANSLLPRPSQGRRYYPQHAAPLAVIDVPVSTVDHYAAEHSLDRIDLLKIDIQGGELLALQGAQESLRTRQIAILHLEAQFVPLYEEAPLLDVLWGFVKPFGYSLYTITDLQTADNGQLRFGDAIFISDQVRSQVVDQFDPEP